MMAITGIGGEDESVTFGRAAQVSAGDVAQ